MLKRLATSLTMIGLLAVGSSAHAVPITGTALFGVLLKTDTGDVNTANTLTFPPAFTVFLIGDGSYSGVPMTAATFQNLPIDPFVGPILNFWSFTSGLTTYSFDLNSLSVTQGGGNLLLNGVGTAHVTGLDDTLETFSLTTQNPGVSIPGDGKLFSFSAASSTVPEPATLLLLGSGLTGLALRRRKQP
jgi:hypothetical protein